MIHVSNRRSLHYQHGAFTDLVFYTVVFLALMNSCRAQSEVIVPSQPVVSLVGEDVILPCHLDPVMNAFDITVEWARPDLNPRFVHLWRQGEELETIKHPSFSGRTSVFIDELEKGNISLKLSKVKVSDEGGYKCFMPALSKMSTVQLVVGSVSSPVVQMTKNNTGVLLECESADWYPEPEMFWLDGEGNLLSAEPTETVRGPDGLYTVSSRVTVEKRHGRKFTCRVTQRKINQTREKHLTIPDHFFVVATPSPPSPPGTQHVVIGAVIGCAALLFIPVIIFVVWRRRQKKFKNKKRRCEDGSEHSEKEKLVTSKSDKTGFQVVNEKEENLPLISVKDENNPDKTGEKSETEDEGQRRETNDGDKSEQETVKPVRDDSGHSMVQIKHINTDQKMEREETQQEAVRDENEKETKEAKGITEEIKVEGTDREEHESVTDKEADTYETQKKHKKITSESKGGEQQLMLQHSDMNKEMRERGVEGQEDLQQEEDMETDLPQPNVIQSIEPLNTQEEGLHMDQQQRDEIRRNSEEDRMQIEANSEMLTQGHEEQNMNLIKEQQQQEEDMETDQTQPNVIQSIEPLNTQEEGLHMDQQQRDEIRRNSEEDRMQIEANSEMLTQGHEEQNMNLIKEQQQQEEDMETDQTQPNVIQSIEPLNTQEEGLHMDQQQRDEIRRNSEEDRMQIEANSEMLTQSHEEQNMNLIKEQQQQEEDMETDLPQPNSIRVEPLNTTFHYESAAEGQSKEAFGRGQKEVQTQNINTDQKMEETTTEIDQRKRKRLEEEDSKSRKRRYETEVRSRDVGDMLQSETKKGDSAVIH
nr:golgin subfamily A member 6-like protein 22 [Labrus bergylta]XP_029138503.1 golgin subfamily A member 6-like protein 22 [Labrus bergylta]XP_029138504.1 golgin subfamily A member 6-like protein 22 [Labrus bergylta]